MTSHDDEPTAVPTPVSKLPLIAMAALVALAVLVGIGLGIRGPTDYPVGSPEALVQEHLDAMLDGDEDAFLATITPRRVSACRDALDGYTNGFGSSGIGFTLDSLEVDGRTAHAEVTERYSDSDPFDSRSRTSERTLDLAQDASGEWKVAEASRPYWLTLCLDPS